MRVIGRQAPRGNRPPNRYSRIGSLLGRGEVQKSASQSSDQSAQARITCSSHQTSLETTDPQEQRAGFLTSPAAGARTVGLIGTSTWPRCIARQKEIIKGPAWAGLNIVEAMSLLQAMETSLLAFERHRQRIVDRLDRPK